MENYSTTHNEWSKIETARDHLEQAHFIGQCGKRGVIKTMRTHVSRTMPYEMRLLEVVIREE
jgi:hypothetical protein